MGTGVTGARGLRIGCPRDEQANAEWLEVVASGTEWVENSLDRAHGRPIDSRGYPFDSR